jgi:hypothetical protein
LSVQNVDQDIFRQKADEKQSFNNSTMTFNRQDDHSISRDTPASTPSSINWPTQKAATSKAEYIDDRPLPTLAKAAAAAEEKKKFPPPKKVVEVPKP